jgi:hypothetical protein
VVKWIYGVAIGALVLSIASAVTSVDIYNKLSNLPPPTPITTVSGEAGIDVFIQPGFANLNITRAYAKLPMVFTSNQWFTIKPLGNFSGEVSYFFVLPANMSVVWRNNTFAKIEGGKAVENYFSLVVTGNLPREWLPPSIPGWTTVTLIVISHDTVRVKSFPILVVK